MNNTSLIGRITRDPELRSISNGNTTTSFNLAVNRKFTNQNGEREADFIPVVVWGKQAENVVKYCQKGSQVGVTGRIQTRSYDAQDGTKKYVTEVIAESVTFLDTKSGQAPKGEPSQAEILSSAMNEDSDPFKNFANEVQLTDEDLPF